MPYIVPANATNLTGVLALLQSAFAGMDGRIDPPSSLHQMTVQDLQQHAEAGELWAIGTAPDACVILTERPNALYIGKLAVAAEFRGRGYARALIDAAADVARARDVPCLMLQTRVELTENHLTFSKLGFVEIGRTAHPGFDRPTSITMRKRL